MNQIDLKGRVAVVTGAASGIGRATAKRLGADGAALELWDAAADGLAETADSTGGTATVLSVADDDAVAAAAAAAAERHGRVDILVNCAGIAGDIAPVAEADPAEWRRVIEVNLTGTFLCCRAVVPHMVRSGYGRIVNIASVAGKEGNPNAAHYSASKAGVITFTRALGKEVAGSGVLVNCITPAVIDTAILGQVTEAQVKYMVERIPLGRMGRPEEVAALIAWLSSEECSFSTAAAFDLSGGRTTY
ncbi:MAG: SDR family NAD(P)-dependent oxidoreductase [Rhodospirillales bacterium]|nr:SDR family NAD(P)-dependent oxidoreductase [Rhodospirillales bacterium]MDE0711307.1 SDR family NAD(P)-dependent oxidoreductase [Rhodospirillales bacterium]